LKRRIANKIVASWLATRETMDWKSCAAAGANYEDKRATRQWRKGTIYKALLARYRGPVAIAWGV
jgi:hypothetical protein